MAKEQGDMNEVISDADSKMDALMDMMRDACAKMDEGGKRLDARMDAMEENFRRVDARMDAAKKDESEEEKKEGEEKGVPEEVAADKARRDAEEKEKEEKAEADRARKDAEEKEREEKAEADKARKDAEKKEGEEAMADSQYMTRAEAAQLRAQIADLQVRAPGIISDSDREKFAYIQEEADPVFQAFNDRAPAPLDGETPPAYKKRLAGKLQVHSEKYKDIRLSSISDGVLLDAVVGEIYADSMVAARKGADVPQGQLRMTSYQSGGHTINEFHGESDAWTSQFSGHSQRATGDWKRPN